MRLGPLPKIAAVLALLMAGTTPSTASAADLPPQGLYDQCSPAQSGDACASRLAQMAQAGFKVVVNYTSWDASPDQLRAFADAAAANGMQVIWPLIHPVWRSNGDITGVYPKLAAACGCSRADALLTYVTGLLSSHPATWGWYIGDELPVTELPAVLALDARVKLLDPAHRTLYIAYEHTGIGGSNLAPYVAAADSVGTAIYPYGTGADLLEQLGFVSSLLRRTVVDRSRVMVLQAFDWAQHPDELAGAGGYPTEAFMQGARDFAIASGASLLLWYSFNDIQASDDPARHWNDLVSAAFSPAAAAAAPIVAPAARPEARTTKAKAKKHRKTRRRKARRGKARTAKARSATTPRSPSVAVRSSYAAWRLSPAPRTAR